MKNIIAIVAICCIMPEIQAQKVIEKRLNFDNKKKLVLDLQITDSINIQTWKKSEVYAYASVNINENQNNEIYHTSFSESGDQLEVKAKFEEGYFKNRKNNCITSEIEWKIMVPENAEISVKTINGNIIITGPAASVKAHTISGFIDMGIASDKKADLSLKTITGNIYTDLQLASNVTNRVVELKILERLNGGGAPINLESVSGDIFLRKR
jgi:predicted membrane protein